MKRYGNLWSQFVSWENLVLAAKNARRGKRHRPVVLRFEFRRETELLRLQRELEGGAWQPGPFTTHRIVRPKPRLISTAPYRDRVVHHALMNVLEPILERHFHPDSYACRKGKGTHAASRRLQRLMGKYPYALPCDVRQFFPSIDHLLLKDLFRRRIKDARLLAVMDAVVDGSNPQDEVRAWFPGDDLFTPLDRRRGLPIGNLTSQWFANWYLDGLDHIATGCWRVGGYVRYCDDFVLLDHDRSRLRELGWACAGWLEQVRLRLHSERLGVRRTSGGLSFVGYRTWASHRRLPAANVRRFLRRVRWLKRSSAAGAVTPAAVHVRLMSWLGHAGQANTIRLVRRLARGWVFTRK